MVGSLHHLFIERDNPVYTYTGDDLLDLLTFFTKIV